jgi:hypothetical protein
MDCRLSPVLINPVSRDRLGRRIVRPNRTFLFSSTGDRVASINSRADRNLGDTAEAGVAVRGFSIYLSFLQV